MQHLLRPPTRATRIRTTWPAQGVPAGTPLGLLPALLQHQPELLSRFTAYYAQLRVLPRRVRRALQRQWRLPLAGVALLLALGQTPGLTATIPVGGTCTLVDAITAANTNTAIGGCPAGSSADTIVLPPGSTQTLTAVNNTTYGPTGLPVISSVITIAGQVSTLVRDSGAPRFRIFAVNSTGNLTLQEMTVSGGYIGSYPPIGGYSRSGGGVASFGGTVTLTNSTISGNEAPFGTGGGIANGGILTVTNSTISGNFGFYGGGGVASSGTLTLTNSIISGNYSGYQGGGVLSFGTLTVTNSTISGNSGGIEDGGGMSVDGTATITNSTISGNDADDGGGLSILFGSTVTLTNSTISGNSTYNGNGGGLSVDGTVTLTNSTISGNAAGKDADYADRYSGGGVFIASSGTLTLIRTLVAGNTAASGPEIFNSGTVLADNHNLFGVNGTAGVAGFSPGATDIVPPAGVLLPDILKPELAANGGPTRTHALVPSSPAIDAGGPVCLDATGNPLATDQRGKPRIVDGNGDGTTACDIGAVEFFPIMNDFVTLDPALDTAFDPTPRLEAPAGTFTITATFTNTSDTPLHFPFFTVTELSGDNRLLNADEGIMGVGATLTPAVGDSILAPGETVAVDFVIGLHVRERFTLLVDLFGEVLP